MQPKAAACTGFEFSAVQFTCCEQALRQPMMRYTISIHKTLCKCGISCNLLPVCICPSEDGTSLKWLDGSSRFLALRLLSNYHIACHKEITVQHSSACMDDQLSLWRLENWNSETPEPIQMTLKKDITFVIWSKFWIQKIHQACQSSQRNTQTCKQTLARS